MSSILFHQQPRHSKLSWLAIMTFALALSACSSFSKQPVETAEAKQINEPNDEPQAAPQPIPADTLYGLLTAEIAGQRKHYDVALVHYLRQAKATKDPLIAERAVRIAQFIGQPSFLEEAIKAWVDAAPTDPTPHLAATQAYLDTGNYQQALVHLEKLNELTQSSQYDFLAGKANLLTKDQQQALLNELEAIKQDKTNDASLWLATGLLQHYLNHNEQALADINQSLKISPKMLSANMQKARLLAIQGNHQQSVNLLNHLQKQHPDHKGVQLLKAKILLDQNKLKDAKKAFDKINKNFPPDPNVILTLALINEELDHKETAQELFYQLIANQQLTNEAHFNLGRMAEKDELPDLAIDHFNAVNGGTEFFPAKARAASLTKTHYGLEAAQKYLEQLATSIPRYFTQFARIEADLLAGEKQYQAAVVVLSRAIDKQPDNIELLYNRALLAERYGDLQRLEQDLRHILTLHPTNINALNALGYTFADHNYNLTEALSLVSQAYNLDPNSPAIIDSLGWVYFRLGDLDKALELLEQAFNSVPDHEIAAHYGELLWLTGEHEKALNVWQQGFYNLPASQTIVQTLERLGIEPQHWPNQHP